MLNCAVFLDLIKFKYWTTVRCEVFARKVYGTVFCIYFLWWKGSNCLLTVPHDLLIPYLKWLNKCVEENSDRDASPEKLDESRSSEQLEEADLDELCDVDNTSNHSDKVKGVPGVFEIVLENIMLD